jgi:hypothetical protein
MKFLRFTKLVVVCAMVFSSTSCKLMSAFNNHTSKSIAAGQITEMPAITIADLDATGRRLASSGLTVLVKRPEIIFNSDQKYGSESFKLPEILRPFEPAHWNHMIATQDPPPGTSLHVGSVITLTAGIHHGAGPFRPWLTAHGDSVNVRSEQRCRDCHATTYCSECHAKLPLLQKFN